MRELDNGRIRVSIPDVESVQPTVMHPNSLQCIQSAVVNQIIILVDYIN